MNAYSRLSSGTWLATTLLLISLSFVCAAQAADTAKLIVEDDGSGGYVARFETLGPCSSKAAGTYGCLRMEKDTSGILTIIFLDMTTGKGWSMEKMQIRKPYENWGTTDSVDADILADFQELGGGGDYFDAKGEHVFTGSPMVAHFRDENQHRFVVQYRIRVKNSDPDKSPIWAHPIIDNEGQQ